MSRLATLALALVAAIGLAVLPTGPTAPVDDTPNANPSNCERSGGALVDGFCECPDGFAPDPADFCLDASGKPGGAMAE